MDQDKPGEYRSNVRLSLITDQFVIQVEQSAC